MDLSVTRSHHLSLTFKLFVFLFKNLICFWGFVSWDLQVKAFGFLFASEMSDDSDPFPHIWEEAGVHGDGGDGGFKPHNPKDPEEDFPRNLNAPAPVSYEQEGKFAENDLPNESNGVLEKDNESNSLFSTKDNNIVWPVLPGESGEGLPYAPVDWPNPGDNWTWRVGRRYNNAGYFQDRFLYPPKHLQRATGGKMFASKPAIEKYIQTHFPGADVNAFFASFTWKVPTKLQTPTKVQAVSVLLEGTPQDEKGKVKEVRGNIRRSGRPKKRPPQNLSETVQEEDNEETPPSGRKKRKQIITASPSTSRQTSRQSVKWSTPCKSGSAGVREHVAPEEFAPIPEDFDDYLNSLDDMIAQSLSESIVPSSTTDSYAAEDEMAEARSKLSSLLVMDFPSLVLSKNLPEVVSLASKVKKDPCLSAEQLVKLKLIEEIPSFSEVFLDSREIVNQVDSMFVALEANKAKATNLKTEYNDLKEKADELQMQVDSSLVAVKEIDSQIAQLQNLRSELISKIESNKAAKVEVKMAQKEMAGEIPGLVLDIQQANSKMPEWVLRKTNAQKREAEVLAKFAPLQGFSL
uniref:Uncharacterized protein MANES_03G177600 n=2 Tax=Rhizophora mucronata TaxID=61149 RepID=A0A2P2KCA1_RHIMU